jgi:dTDP-4-amino-4,6-dideoxygalactose transaminase
VHHMPYLRSSIGEGPVVHTFPAADEASGRVVSLPLYPSLTDAQVDAVADAIQELGGASALARSKGSPDA